MTQFDLSSHELDNLHSKRWNFSSSTTRVSDKGSNTDLDNLSLPRETVEEAFHRLRVTINTETLRNSKQRSLEEVPNSPLLVDSPLDSPLLGVETVPPVKPHPLQVASLRGAEARHRVRILNVCSMFYNSLDVCVSWSVIPPLTASQWQ